MTNAGPYNIPATALEKEIVRLSILTASRLIAEDGKTLDQAVELACQNSWSEFQGYVREFLMARISILTALRLMAEDGQTLDQAVALACLTACRLMAEDGKTLDQAVELACPNSWSEFRGCVRAFLSGERMDFNDAELNAAQMAKVFRMLYRRVAIERSKN